MNNFKLVSFFSLTDEEKYKFFDFCKTASLETEQPASVNMWHDEWKTRPNTLPYILTYTERFSKGNGDFSILLDGENVVCCGGVYISEFEQYISLAGTRTWTSKKYRHKTLIRDYILPYHKFWSINRGCKQIALCFNEYNKNMIKIFYRSRLGESPDRIFQRSPKHLFYSNIYQVPFPVNIQNTPQWVVYESLDTGWEFNWSSLKL